MGRPLKIKESTTVDIGFNPFSQLVDPTIPTGMTVSEYLGVVGGGYPSGIATAAYPTVAVTAYFAGGVNETPAYIITQKGQTKYLVASNNTINGGSFVVGTSYIIKSLGTTTNWQLAGAGINPQVGDVFTATSTGTGDGTVSSVATCVLTNLAAGALTTAGQMQITISTGGTSLRVSKLTNKFVWDFSNNRYAANFFVAGASAANPLAGVAVTGTAGQFSCTADTLSIGQVVTVTGSNTGTATGVTAGTYYIVATDGSTTFTLSATAGGAGIVTTAGTIATMTFTVAASTVAKSGADIATWSNGTGDLALAEVSDYTA